MIFSEISVLCCPQTQFFQKTGKWNHTVETMKNITKYGKKHDFEQKVIFLFRFDQMPLLTGVLNSQKHETHP